MADVDTRLFAEYNRTVNTDEQFWERKTFDDFLLRPQNRLTEFRQNISLTSRLTEALQLELPILSANMDSVTGMRMVRVMALEGGIGVIHRSSSIDQQQAKVARVKRR